jgi:hypothetical protein
MAKFDLRKVEAVRAKQELDELVIDGVGQLEAFERMVFDTHSTYKTEYEALINYVQYVADGNSLRDTKFRDVTPKGELVKEYEFKSKHLRLYAIKKLNGKIVILGGLKTTQQKDFKRFRSLKDQYLNSL